MAQMDNIGPGKGGTVGNGAGFRPGSQRGNGMPAPGVRPGKGDSKNVSDANRHSKAPGNAPIRPSPLKPEPGYSPDDRGGPFGDRDQEN
jgi:hypothetical protein